MKLVKFQFSEDLSSVFINPDYVLRVEGFIDDPAQCVIVMIDESEVCVTDTKEHVAMRLSD